MGLRIWLVGIFGIGVCIVGNVGLGKKSKPENKPVIIIGLLMVVAACICGCYHSDMMKDCYEFTKQQCQKSSCKWDGVICQVQ